ncbi:MAG: hypothetical protein JXR83_05315, partial [Deltaproteobacteria bacterium]|nr:hypothetical protein [Deltaproteobacteria bacterium]
GSHGTLGADVSIAGDDPTWQTAPCIGDRIAATTPDGGSGVDAGGRPSCDSLYGGVNGYELCHENATTCEFAATTSSSTCGVLCFGLGQTCLDAFDNVTPVCDRREWMGDTCDTVRGSEICVCTR